ncbi:MAG: hypothetical protein M4D80_14335 [Myxococcota bacterium]|nr:hypothetical protein [Myxococcota bacterium]
MTKYIAVVLALAAGCGKKADETKAETKPAEPAGPPAGYVAHANIPELFIQLPPDAKPVDNKFGSGWFENADKSFAITYKPADHADMAKMKATIGELVGKWVKEEQTADGYVLSFQNKDDGLYGLQMARKVGSSLYKCTTGTAKDEAAVEAVIKACNSLRTK